MAAFPRDLVSGYASTRRYMIGREVGGCDNGTNGKEWGRNDKMRTFLDGFLLFLLTMGSGGVEGAVFVFCH